MANPTVSSIATSAGQNFFPTMFAQSQQALQGQQAALQEVSNAWNPVLQTGAVPFGFSPQLDSLLISQGINTSAGATTNAENAAALRATQASGGANVAPTGAQAATEATIGAVGQQGAAANTQATQLAGFQQGVQNLEGGTQAELGVASGEQVPQLEEAATGEGALGLNAGQAQFAENQVTSPLNLTSDVLGDVAKGAALFG